MINLLRITSKRNTIRIVKGWAVIGHVIDQGSGRPVFPIRAFTSKARADNFAALMLKGNTGELLFDHGLTAEVVAIMIDINLENIPCPEILLEA